MKERSHRPPRQTTALPRESGRRPRKAKSTTLSKRPPPIQESAQPQPVTPGITKLMVREHARMLYRDKLNHGVNLTLSDWVLAEKDLVAMMENDEMTIV